MSSWLPRWRHRWKRVEANLKSRVATAFIAIPLLILIIGWGGPLLFTVVFLLLNVAALHEFFAMAFPARTGEQALGIVFGAAVFLRVVQGQPAEDIALGLLLVVYFCAYLFMPGELQDRLIRLALILLGGLYLGYLLPQWIVLFRLAQGRYWVAFVLIVIMSGDTVAYFAGKRFGKRKLAPSLSPGKTLEGCAGYIAGSAAAGLLAGRWFFADISGGEIFALSVVLSVLGQLGDLFESWIKRAFAVKDSGRLLPGHGGILDRLDSLIFPAVFTSAYLRLFHS
jgi:phosphatidate cytidylyltransferase